MVSTLNEVLHQSALKIVMLACSGPHGFHLVRVLNSQCQSNEGVKLTDGLHIESFEPIAACCRIGGALSSFSWLR